MKCILAFVLLVASTQAIDVANLKPMRMSAPQLYPRYTAEKWEQIRKNQEFTPEVYPGYKKGTKPQPASAGVAHPHSRVVGGQIANHGQFPWQVLIFMDNSYVCGGSLIAEDWVLSAGHCASDFSSFIITLGAQSSQYEDPGSVKVTTRNKIVHSQYDPYNINNDISLLRLPEPVTLTNYIGVARLPGRDMVGDDLVGETVTVSGWGKPSDSSGGISEQLRYTSMPVMSNRECADVYGNVITASKICTDTQGGHSSCNGDSGGPLVLQMSDGRYTEVGIVSFGSSAGCEVGYPAAFTRVTSFLDWIESNTGIRIQ